MFNEILNKAINKNSSDIHFIPTNNKVYIKLRIQDELIHDQSITKILYIKLLTFMKYQANLDVSTSHKAQSGRYIYKYKDLYYLRISTLPLSLGLESCVIRIVPHYFNAQQQPLKFPYLYDFMSKKQGLLLFTGPTGSGKSTTMYHMSMYAKENLNLNVITIEDPVERIINGITQVSVNEKAGINYQSTFKAILRCDPDVILIGEIRNQLIAKQVIHASLSGHLVLTTMHANNCKGVLLRLLEMDITKQELTQSILNITNQRLVTSSDNQRILITENMSNADINYFFEHNYKLPDDFHSLPEELKLLSEEGVICEETYQKYI